MMLHYRAFSVATHPGLVEAIKKSMLVLAKTVSIKMTFLGKPCIAFFLTGIHVFANCYLIWHSVSLGFTMML